MQGCYLAGRGPEDSLLGSHRSDTSSRGFVTDLLRVPEMELGFRVTESPLTAGFALISNGYRVTGFSQWLQDARRRQACMRYLRLPHPHAIPESKRRLSPDSRS